MPWYGVEVVFRTTVWRALSAVLIRITIRHCGEKIVEGRIDSQDCRHADEKREEEAVARPR